MVNISKNKHLFENIGVKIMLDDYEKISLLNDKIKTYKLLENVKEVNIPPYFLVNSVDEFVRAYEDLSKDFESICMKFVKDEGAKSFRRIIKDVEKFESLKSYPSFKIGYNEAVEIFKTKENFDDLMVMPYLDGFEISVDCLKTHKGTIAIPRIKSNTRAEKISFDEKIVKMSQTIMEKLDLILISS